MMLSPLSGHLIQPASSVSVEVEVVVEVVAEVVTEVEVVAEVLQWAYPSRASDGL
jgi:hypothetical protein